MATSTIQSASLRNARSEACWVAWTALICAHFSLVYNLNNRPFLNLAHYAAGNEALPFQSRVLMAWLFRALAGNGLVLRIAQALPIQARDPFLAIQLVTSMFCLAGAIAFTRGSISFLTGDRDFSKWSAWLVAYMAYFNLPLIYGLGYTLPYDLPSLFFFSGCVFCILRRKYFLFYVLFLLGTFNRETICFVTLFFLCWERSRSTGHTSRTITGKLAIHVALQGMIWIGIKLYLRHRFALNPEESGGTSLFIPHFQYNLRELIKPQQWPLLASNFGFTLPLLVSQRSWILNPGIARACAIILPLWFCLMFYVGVIIEIRIYTELIAFVSLGVALILFHKLRRTDGQGDLGAASR